MLECFVVVCALASAHTCRAVPIGPVRYGAECSGSLGQFAASQWLSDHDGYRMNGTRFAAPEGDR